MNQLARGKGGGGWVGSSSSLLLILPSIQEDVGTGLIILLFGPCAQTHTYTHVQRLSSTFKYEYTGAVLILAQVLSH